MGRPTIIEVDFYALQAKLRTASDRRQLVEKSDTDKWRQFLTEHQVREASLLAFGKVRFSAGKPVLVAIAMGDERWDGCYVYSAVDEIALKYVPGN